MATVLKAGDDAKAVPAWVGKQLICSKCTCIFVLTADDGVEHNYYEPDIASVECPTCKRRVKFADYSMGR